VTLEGAGQDLQASCARLAARRDVNAADIFRVGFCMGGKGSFLANPALPLHATSFYGGGIAPELLTRVPDVRAPMLLVWGGLDKPIKPEHRAGVTPPLPPAARNTSTANFLTADHAFFCDERPSYNARAAEPAWVLLLEFFRSE
jgi:carboxymethylenebutenolidase